VGEVHLERAVVLVQLPQRWALEVCAQVGLQPAEEGVGRFVRVRRLVGGGPFVTPRSFLPFVTLRSFLAKLLRERFGGIAP
jgi:hypothetical protein